MQHNHVHLSWEEREKWMNGRYTNILIYFIDKLQHSLSIISSRLWFFWGSAITYPLIWIRTMYVLEPLKWRHLAHVIFSTYVRFVSLERTILIAYILRTHNMYVRSNQVKINYPTSTILFAVQTYTAYVVHLYALL